MLKSETEDECAQELFPFQRYQWILETLSREGNLLATEAAKRLRVSIDTIRRDVIHLAAEGHLQRVHGGALPVSISLRPASERINDRRNVKTAIAGKASQLIQPGNYVLMDGGTTNIELVARVDIRLPFTLVTNNVKAALVLAERQSAAEIILLGGRLDPHDLISLQATTVSEIARFRCDLYFMGICGIHPEAGLTCRTFDDLEIKRAMASASTKVIGLADLQKLGTAGSLVLGPVTMLDALVTESEDPRLEAYRKRGIDII
jgi:DeoR/GlpR family transcriptional regulator of sugar metabolism